MLRKPSRRNYKYKFQRPNLIPVLDAVFIFIFFLLLSANFMSLFEINSNVPIVSSSPPPKKKKKPLNLTLKIYKNKMKVLTGIPLRTVKSIKNINNKYDLTTLHDLLISIKRKNIREKTIILEPLTNVEYEVLVMIMDSVRILQNTDPSLFIKDKDNQDRKVFSLFDDIVFGNIKS